MLQQHYFCGAHRWPQGSKSLNRSTAKNPSEITPSQLLLQISFITHGLLRTGAMLSSHIRRT